MSLIPRYKKYAYGANLQLDRDAGLGLEAAGQGLTQAAANMVIPGGGAIAGAVGNIGGGLIDLIDKPDKYGNQSLVASIMKGNLKGGPIGAIGAAIHHKELKRKSQLLRAQDLLYERQDATKQAEAGIAADPTLLTGNPAVTSYYADGGRLGPGPKDTTGTRLTRAEQIRYEAWRSKLPKALQYEGDYDLKGLWKSNPKIKPSANLHFPDTYKLPNHPTFSNESIYFNDSTRRYAGHWNETDSSWNYIPYDTSIKDTIVEKKYAEGGHLIRPGNVASQPVMNGEAEPLSSTAAQFEGPSHEQGGIQLPALQSEVEGKETTEGNYVFSERLGFAQAHKPLAKAIGKIEQKALTPERVNSLKLLRHKIDQLRESQERVKDVFHLQ